jgi:hypothetical protein
MKEDEMTTSTPEQKLQHRLLLRTMAGDRLMLADSTLLAALEGRRALTANELQALQQSPLTLRRFRHLALARRPALRVAGWHGSHGMLRAAAASSELVGLATDDGCWSLHFLAQDAGWQVILKLEAHAPFAAQMMRSLPLLRVVDGGGAIVLQGRLDGDGECESRWPFESPPAEHLQQHGATFAVEPMAP